MTRREKCHPSCQLGLSQLLTFDNTFESQCKSNQFPVDPCPQNFTTEVMLTKSFDYLHGTTKHTSHKSPFSQIKPSKILHCTVSHGLQLIHLIARKQGVVVQDCMFLSKLPIFSTGHTVQCNPVQDQI